MILAAFDIASRTGITILNGERIAHVETWKPSAKRPKGLGPQEINIEYEAELGEEFRDHILSTLGAWRPEYVGYEEPRTRDYERTKQRFDPTAQWAGAAMTTFTERASSNLAMVRSLLLCAHLCGVCRRKNIPVMSIPGNTWRKAFLGYSRAPKGTKDGRKFLKQACIAQCKLIGVNVPNDDAGDSVGVGWALRGLLGRGAARPGDLFAKSELQGAA